MNKEDFQAGLILLKSSLLLRFDLSQVLKSQVLKATRHKQQLVTISQSLLENFSKMGL